MRVLLVEDDTILGVAVRDQIAADGHSVDWVKRLDEAGDSVRSVPTTSCFSTSCCPTAGASTSCAPAVRRGM